VTLPSPSPARLPRPWADAPSGPLKSVVGVLTDIDDTLTTTGAITADALDALARLASAGIHVIAITGRPMGWGEPFARTWPVDAIVAENGAVAMFREPAVSGSGSDPSSALACREPLHIEYVQDESTRARNAFRLRETAARVLREIPGATLARDSAGRVTDIAIDHNEFERLTAPQIEAVLSVMRADGMNATVSSIHINGWFGTHTKLSGAKWIVERLFGRDLDSERERWVYVGDSTNDQAMFGRFPLSVGVANLMDFRDALSVWPAYLTTGARGAGFAEVEQRLLEAHRGPSGGPAGRIDA
jgi:HAD superfamily hydrolase (TIGR01484 family)